MLTQIQKVSAAVLCCALTAWGAVDTAVEEHKADLASFELVWKTLQDQYWDQSMAGLDWRAIHGQYLREVQASRSTAEARSVIARMIHRLPGSHLAVIPGEMYRSSDSKRDPSVPNQKTKTGAPSGGDAGSEDSSGSTGLTLEIINGSVVVGAVEAGSPGAKASVRPGWTIDAVDGQSTKSLFTEFGDAQPAAKALLVKEVAETWLNGPPNSAVNVLFVDAHGKSVARALMRETVSGETVRFGNLPPEHVRVEYRKLEDGVGYIRLNLFLDPVNVMPQIEKAVGEFKSAPGIVLDLRDNPGGLAIMAMGIAGWFVSEGGMRLGDMTSRDATLHFVINPRLNPYEGRLAVLVNGGSASTAEILAQGLQDLGRARIFGTRSAGAALPSNIIQLPNGDRFQYPQANYVSAKGRILEGNGVEPDTAVAPTIPALLAGKDLPLEAAKEWSKGK